VIDIRTAIEDIVDRYTGALFVSTCGYISRDLLANGDRDENFYLVGSMGMAAPIGLGIALARPDRTVVVLDGDGSFAMNLGCLPVIAQNRPNLVHVVLDNAAHASTGGQRTVPIPDSVGVAIAAGYAEARTVESISELRALDWQETGPRLLHVRCLARDYAIGARLKLTPPQLVERFRAKLDAGFVDA
jgi:sulfopyruvate decarboxylase subunit beta